MRQKKNKIHLLTLWVVTLFFALPLKAQVNIGSQDNPHSFSILELTTKQKDGGLRMPQLNDEEQAAVEARFNENPETAEAAKGLVIYNTDADCMEFWNGKKWIGLCSDALPPPPPIVVPETNPTSNTNGNILITTYANAMYDFQFQQLTAYLALGTSGTVTAYQWQMSTDSATWYDIVDATSKNYVVPVDFMYSLGSLGLDKNNTATSANAGNGSIEIQFRCQMTIGGVTANTDISNILSMLFIRTNTSGYGIDPTTGVRYLTINRGVGGTPKGGAIKIALLNLGASGTGSYINGVPQNIENGELNDAGDLGDFYQWGRVADGHEHIVWSKDVGVYLNRNKGTPYGSGSGFTSDSITRNYDLQAYTSSPTFGQIQEGTYGYGKFIKNGGGSDWGGATLATWPRWGNESNTRAGVPANLSGWTHPANNPCPGNWYVPSQYDFADIYRSKGINPPAYYSEAALPPTPPYTSTADNSNDFTFRSYSCKSVGGVIITNPDTGERVFLPAVGYRLDNNATISVEGGTSFVGVNYWTSTAYIPPSNSYDGAPRISATSTSMGSTLTGGMWTANGYSVRCVAQ